MYNMSLTDVHARFIFYLFIFIIKLVYGQSPKSSFSAKKHNKMLILNRIARRIFNISSFWVGKNEKNDYTITVNYEGCAFIVRPYIFSEVIMVSGRWEPYVKDILDKQVKWNDVIVDVGANIGIYAVPLAKRASKVIAFEPHPKTSEILRRNIDANNAHNVILLKKLAGDSKRKVSYRLSVDPQESGVVSALDKETDSIVETECIDLDSALAIEHRIDWLLIDVEGFELDVLNGAKRLLQKHSPQIIFESHSQDSAGVINLLEKQGYSVRQIYSIYYYAKKTSS
jgi:FkbM family methyltransferase